MKYTATEDEDGFSNIIDEDTKEVFFSSEELYDLNQDDYTDQCNKIAKLLNTAYNCGWDDIKEIHDLNDSKGN